jgi:Alpha/beta hydrolase family
MSGMSTVVLVHAFGSSSRVWSAQVAALSDRHRVLTVDLPGHGDDESPFTLERAVESVHAMIGEGEGGGIRVRLRTTPAVQAGGVQRTNQLCTRDLASTRGRTPPEIRVFSPFGGESAR